MDVSRLTKFPVRYAVRGAQRGLALVTVLWVLMLLALMAAGFTRTMRLEVNLARKRRGPSRGDAGSRWRRGEDRRSWISPAGPGFEICGGPGSAWRLERV